MLCVHAGHKAQKDAFLDLQGLDFKNWTGTAQFTKSPSSCALDMEEGRSVAGARKSTVFFVICTKAWSKLYFTSNHSGTANIEGFCKVLDNQ